MAKASEALQITGVGTSIQLSTAINVSPPLSAGVYALWVNTQTAYVTTGAPPSTTLTALLGMPVITSQKPTLVNIQSNGQIAGISTSSGTLLYQQVG